MCLYGLIGYPLSHSFSQRYFTEKFVNEGCVGYSYRNFPLNDIRDLHSLLEQQPDLRGFNVTIPYKEQIIPFLDEMDRIAEEIGAVNTVQVSRNGKKTNLKGYNTDVYGFAQSLEECFQVSGFGFHTRHCGLDPQSPKNKKIADQVRNDGVKQALVLGTGGASKAVVCALSYLGIDAHLVSRREGQGVYKTYNQLTIDDITAHLLIVNTTPLGMFPNTGECPAIPYQYLTEKHLLYDLVYNPEETLFMRKGREMGAVAYNGERMLHLQADKAWEIWKSAPTNRN